MSDLSFEWPDMGPEYAKAAGKPDWRYRDQPWMSKAHWAEFIGIVGEENFQFLVSTSRGDLMRGQFLISPEGIERIRQRGARSMTRSYALLLVLWLCIISAGAWALSLAMNIMGAK